MSKSATLCCICNKAIPAARISALKMLGTPEYNWTHVACSQVTPHKGIYMGEHGTSEMKIVDKVYEDSVRDMFKGDSKSDDDE